MMNKANKHDIIFQENSTIFRQFGQPLYGHREFNERRCSFYYNCLTKSKFNCLELKFRDTIAFSLSGGFIGMQLIPNSQLLYRIVLRIDRALNGILQVLHLQKYFCFRFILSGERVEN